MSTPTGTSAVDSARTLLFVPGNSPGRFDKAVAAGADLVVVDLEDAVPAVDKDGARAETVAWLASLPAASAARVVVRVNAVGTPWHEPDLEAVAGRAVAVMVAKAEAGTPLTAAGRGTPVIALIETASGVLDAPAIATTEGVVRLAFGSFDLAAELGIDPLDADALRASRSALVLASAAAGIAGPIDGVHAAIDDSDALRAETDAGRRLGFAGKLCIHPRQVPVVDAVLRPGIEELAWAQRILAAAEAQGGGVVAVEGHMVDKPVIERARRIAAAAEPKEGSA